MSRRMNRWLGAVALLAVVAAAGCSSDGDSATTDSTTDVTAGAAATTEAVTAPTDTEPADTTAVTADTTAETTPDTSEAEAVEAPTGEPIKFMAATAVAGVVAQPEIFDAVDAAVTAINDDGGIADPAGGPNRPLEVVRCEAGAGGNVDPDVALRCAQDSIDAGRHRRARQVPVRCRRHPGLGPGRHPHDRHLAGRDRGLHSTNSSTR